MLLSPLVWSVVIGGGSASPLMRGLDMSQPDWTRTCGPVGLLQSYSVGFQTTPWSLDHTDQSLACTSPLNSSEKGCCSWRVRLAGRDNSTDQSRVALNEG
eukprot:CAMPEP_0118930116 /NCGR_PEP_ID=MMETSP1169-20130426/6915_1 /TAXON_ID=36882 /ORGANISM="Pyramimonas obovata, Strain CCMP722" /LENGTH=99 /DNA_ID=CAMNT_0006872429 /DNA_START=183 /DNA_END=482 /DNA_ORIENTATION=+